MEILSKPAQDVLGIPHLKENIPSIQKEEGKNSYIVRCTQLLWGLTFSKHLQYDVKFVALKMPDSAKIEYNQKGATG
jgi:hypothetical protein